MKSNQENNLNIHHRGSKLGNGAILGFSVTLSAVKRKVVECLQLSDLGHILMCDSTLV